MLLCGSSATAAEADQQKLERLRQRIAELQTSLNEVRGQHAVELRELQSVESDIGRVARELRRLGHKQQGVEDRVSDLKQEGIDLRAQVVQQQRLLANQLRAAYAMGRQQQVKMLLSQQTPATVSRMIGYYRYFNRARQDQLRDLNASQRAVADNENHLTQQLSELANIARQRESDRARLLTARKDRQQLLAQLSLAVEDTDTSIQRLRADEQRMLELVDSLSQQIEAELTAVAAPSFVASQGQLQWPVQGTLKARFGHPRGVGRLRWDGVLIEAGEGDAVYAVAPGQVVFADWLRGFGLLLIVDHGQGYLGLYGHNQSLFKELGEWVEVNDTIASVGNSGGHRGIGLYFEIRHDGQPVDPGLWCRLPPSGRLRSG